MNPKYRSGKSVAKNPTISIDADDPRVAWDKVKQTFSRQGSEIDIVGIDGKSLIAGGKGLNSESSSSADQNTVKAKTPKIPGVPPVGTPPLQVTNFVATWGTDGSIILNFDFDTTASANFFIDRFLVKVYDSATSKYYDMKAGFGYAASTFLNTSSVSQQLTLTLVDIYRTLDINTVVSNISKVAIATADIITVGQYVEDELPAFVSQLPQPIFTLTAGIDNYTVNCDPTNIALALTKGFSGVVVEEKITDELVKANVSLVTGWVQASPVSPNANVVVYAPDELHRWVRLRYVDAYGIPSVYSDIQDVTPLEFMPTNTNPPTQFTSGSIAWSGNDISVSFAKPSTNAGTVIKVKLVPFVNGIESTSLYAHYYHTIVDPETSFKILSSNLYGQFGAYYSKFKGYITAVSAQGIETTGSVIIAGPVERTTTLTTVYPTLGTPNINNPTGLFRVTEEVNGYTVEFDLPAGATRLEVYEKSTPWTVVPTNDDNVVYSGVSPAIINSPNNDTRYVIVRYYDQYDNYSYYSMEVAGQTAGVTVNPIDIGLSSLIESPIKIATDGSIFSGAGDYTVYPQVFFNRDGLFAYDADGDWTTQIINSAASEEPTFFTKRAVIGDWSVAPTGLENTLYASGAVKDYTGMSASLPYAFWAGAETSKNTDGLAKFSVTPTGQVVASKITINGDGTGGDLVRAGGSNFIITQAGALTAQSAIIKGTIEVDGQSYFDANVNIRNGYLIAGSGGVNVGPNVQIGSMGLQALNASSNPTTKIYTSPLSVSILNAVTGNTTTVDGITLWSKKVLFGANESSGWVISDGVIEANYISLSSATQSLVIRSKTSNSSAGIVLQSSTDSDYAISVGNISNQALAPFSVSTTGDLIATSATIRGTVNAASGGFGLYDGATLTHGWTISGVDSKGKLTATGTAEIDLSSGGKIMVGNYDIKSSGTDFSIVDRNTQQTIIKTDLVANTNIYRVYLGQVGRQVEVAKNAEISGSYDGSAQDYRSGGLRNMYTIVSSQYASNVFPNAGNGSVLLVYT